MRASDPGGTKNDCQLGLMPHDPIGLVPEGRADDFFYGGEYGRMARKENLIDTVPCLTGGTNRRFANAKGSLEQWGAEPI
jgi:hypothetical protein